MAKVISSSGQLVKLGRIIPDRFLFVPCPIIVSPEIVRIYVAAVGEDRVGRVKYFEVDSANPMRVLRESTAVSLDIGVPGAFDDNGVTPMCIVRDGERMLLYYTGWQLSDKVRYLMFTGAAESFDGGETFKRVRRTPVLERNDGELICRTAAFVMRDGDRFRAWYIGGSETIFVNGKQLPTYSLHYAESADGVTWGAGREIMKPNGPREFGFGRPWVRKVSGGFEMWYSIRNADIGYRIAYATSPDGLDWSRQDYFGLDVGDGGWDGEMTAFSSVFETSAGTFLLYNGNGYGATGVGVARVVRSA